MLQLQGYVLVGDQREPVTAPEVEEALPVAVLAQDAGGVQVAPLGQVLVDPVALVIDEGVDRDCREFRV